MILHYNRSQNTVDKIKKTLWRRKSAGGGDGTKAYLVLDAVLPGAAPHP